MRRLILFRHSEAVHSEQYRDHERPLTAAGRKDADARRRAARGAGPGDRPGSGLGFRADAGNLGHRARPLLASRLKRGWRKTLYEADRRDLMDLVRQSARIPSKP